MATTLFLLSFGFNVRRSEEFPVRAPPAWVRQGKGGCGGAASMTLEVLHGALVLLGRRARRKRAEIAAAAGLRVDYPRIEAIAARLELADHRRLPRAACALRMLRFAARRCVLVAIVNLHRWSRRFANREEAAKVSAHLRVFALTHRQNSGPDRRARC
jgi:hypothetical protein